ncbi:spore germination lipoprotein GerD [Metabacillus iocasae]|uniref:Spore germination protein D n=1 Tax=Priestia iocasae TaxID=2291674 RepID=A0ABS2R277_9BACI|nr:spore germination lipoprotein GerD [Metabacillus iocasae]MBM7705106.1 spore germination protein D [Metabacillus iocasae]
MKKKPLLLLLYATTCALLLGACAPQDEEGGMDYDQTKKMVVDILKTDDGKKAIQEVLKDEEIKKELVMDQAMVKETITTTLTSEKGVDFWKQTFSDPKFAETFAKSVQKEQEALMKKLIKDPEYQASLMEVLKNPEMEKQVVEVLKGQEFRAHLQKVMTETFESPLYKAKIQDLLMKAAAETQGEGSSKEKSEEGSEESGGSEGGASEQEQG